MSQQLNTDNLTYDLEANSSGEVKINNSALTYVSSVPKSKCPPAKPPRRKLSYPNEYTKGNNDESLQSSSTKSPNDPKNVLNNSSTKYNEVLSKSSSSASSKRLSTTSGTEGSDYGSLQGDNQNPRMSYHPEKCRNSLLDPFCKSTPKVPERRRNSIQSTWPTVHSPASIYYTPLSTPKSTFNWTYGQSRFQENQKALKLAEKILGQKSSSIYRRHNSDPQIALERRPSRRGIRQRAVDRRSHSFLGLVGSTAFGCSRFSKQWEQSCYIEKSSYLLLSEEVKMLRDMCDKLWEQLRQTQLKLELFQNNTTSNQSSPSFSDLLSEVYYAQRDRDKAVQERLELFMTERQYLLAQVENLREIIFRRNIHKVETSDDEIITHEEPKSLDKVLEALEICNSPSKLEEHQKRLLRRVKQAKEIRQTSLAQQLSKVTSQRDAAIAQLNAVTNEMQGFQWEAASQHPKQEEESIKRLEELREEVESLQLCYSLQSSQQNPSLSLEAEDICFYSLDKTEATPDVDLLKALLKAEYRARTQKEEQCQKLERLVNVLRKKLLGNKMGIPV